MLSVSVQALTQLTLVLTAVMSGRSPLALFMGADWITNLLIAEWIISKNSLYRQEAHRLTSKCVIHSEWALGALGYGMENEQLGSSSVSRSRVNVRQLTRRCFGHLNGSFVSDFSRQKDVREECPLPATQKSFSAKMMFLSCRHLGFFMV